MTSKHFAEMKRRTRTKSYLKKLQESALNDSYEYREDTKLTQRTIRNRVRTALSFSGEDELLFNFENCSARKKCQSLWCESCRQDVSTQTLKRWLRHVNIDVDMNEDFLHITGVLGITDVDENEVQSLLDGDANSWKSIRRRIKSLDVNDYKFIDVCYELELINTTYLMNSNKNDFKKKQIVQLRRRDKKTKEYSVFVHWHGITNLTKVELNEVVGKRYFIDDEPLLKHNQVNGLYVQSLHRKQSLEKNLWKMSSYCFKTATRFKHSYLGSDLGEELMTAEELSALMVLYQSVQGRQHRGLFRSATNKTERYGNSFNSVVKGSVLDQLLSQQHRRRY